MYIERFLKIKLPKGISCFLWGARKTGKSTYLKHHFPNAIYIDLLKADILRKYSTNPERLREEIEANPDVKIIIIDEIQKIPAFLDEVHYMIEEFKSLNFILCGSSIKSLKSTGANLLGGRAWRYMFMPLSYPELKELNWERIFNHGLIPQHYFAKNSIDKYHASYLYDYVLSEVQFEAKIRKKESFAKFLEIGGNSNGEMVNYNNIARDCGIDAKSVKFYFDILEEMYLGYYLYPYKSKTRRQIIREKPKFYLFDIGIANYLKNYRFKSMEGIQAGKAFEHYVFLELMAYKKLNNKREPVNYWRTKDGYEVDLIFQNEACEIKISDNIKNHHLKSLRKFSEDNKHSLHIICLEKKKRIIDGKITIWPIEVFLKELWKGRIWK